MVFAVGAVIGAGAALVGTAITASSQSDAIEAQMQATREANKLERDQFEYQKELQKPYNTAGVGALGLISQGLGIAPQVETKEQIRARLSGQQVLPNTTGQDLSNSNMPWAWGGNTDNSNLNTQQRINNLNAEYAQLSNSSSRTSDNRRASLEAERNRLFSQLAKEQKSNPQLSNTDLDAQVEAEYQRQLQAQQTAQNSAGFGEFNKDFTAQDFDVNKDPGAVFRQQEAMKALQRTYAGSGNFLSGGALKGITQYNQDFASQEFGNAFNRFNINKTNRFNRLATVAGLGQTSANTLGNAGQNFAQNVGNNATNLGNSIGSASLYGGRQLNNAIQQGANSISNYLSNRIPTPNPMQGWGGTTADPWYG